MAYSTGLLNDRVKILNKVRPTQGDFGATTRYAEAAEVWAGVTWNKGVKSLREGALDAYDTIMVRMRYNTVVSRESRLEHDGVTYQIQSIHRDRQDNTIQITATEVVQ